MLFTSIEFLFLFLPAALAGYYLLPFRWNLKNYFLLAASLGFYAWGEPKFVFAMLASIVFNYVAALALEALRGRGRLCAAKWILAASVAGNLSVIGVWKYANFVTATLREWFPSWQGAVPRLRVFSVGRIPRRRSEACPQSRRGVVSDGSVAQGSGNRQ